MLKIKDPVDLKELEKYGFLPYRTIWSSDGNIEEGVVEYCLNFEFGERNYGQSNCTGVQLLNVNPKTKKLSEYIDNRFEHYVDIKNARLNALFDLIQAGLVEKV